MVNNRNYSVQIQEVIREHQGLEFDEKSNKLFGSLIVDINDEYEVEIDLSPFPDAFPIVKEVGERIRPTADRHIYTDTLACCFTTKAWENILIRTEVKTIQCFINKIAIPYFQNQSYYQIKKRYKHGEYLHGTKGIIQGYQDILKIKDEWVITMILLGRVRKYKIRPNDKCYCDSNKKLKNCHTENYKKFKLIEKVTIQNDLYRMADELI